MESPGAGTIRRGLKVVLIARALGLGGAERQLVALATGLRGRGHDPTILLFYPENLYQDRLEAADVAVRQLEKQGRWDVLRFGPALRRALAELRPDVVYSFLPMPNLLAAALRPFLPRHSLVWSLRASNMEPRSYDGLSRLALRLEPAFSRVPDLIIANSDAGRAHALSRGFSGARIAVVPNGIDLDRFRPLTPGVRTSARARLGLRDDWTVVGHLARYDPMKDHNGFLRALAGMDQRFHAVIAGFDPGSAPELVGLAEALDLQSRITWAGPVSNVMEIYAALDLVCVSSVNGEGFPNVLGEAMACGIPCVATDVGDSAIILGGLGSVVAPGNASALAAGMALAAGGRSDPEIGRRLRARIAGRYGIEQMVETTERLLLNLCDDKTP
jgi:glycosyltransferase involved in cell wall biosynthesis